MSDTTNITTSRQRPHTVHVLLMGEGEYEVPLAADGPITLGELLGGLGITDRGGHLYMNGLAANSGTVVEPGSRTEVLPRIYGG